MYLNCLIGLSVPQCNEIIQSLGFEALGVAFHDKKAKTKQWSTVVLNDAGSAINLCVFTLEDSVIYRAEDWGQAAQLFHVKEAA